MEMLQEAESKSQFAEDLEGLQLWGPSIPAGFTARNWEMRMKFWLGEETNMLCTPEEGGCME